MYLYKFIDSKWGLAAIKQRRLKLTRILEANDPFEFLGLAVRDREGRRYINQKRQELHSALGLLCLSADWRHPLMWTHYAEDHKGLCLGFDVSRADWFWPVTYLTRRLELNDIGKAKASDIDTGDIGNLLYSKFNGWAYEQEYRTGTALEPEYLDLETNHYFIPFNDKMRLAKVIVGYKSAVSRAAVADALGNISQEVDAFKVRPAFRDFSLTRNLQKKAWR